MPFAPSSLRSLPINDTHLHALPINNTRLAHLRAYVPLPSSIGGLCAFVLLQKLLSVNSCAKKFNIIRKDHGHTQRYKFSVLDQKHLFWANPAQNIKIISLS